MGLSNSSITATASDGNGGNIQITTQGLFFPLEKISADSQIGINGVVNIQGLKFDERNTLIPLNNNFINSNQVVAESCLTERNKQSGSFLVTGTGGLPSNPYSMTSDYDSLTRKENLQSEMAPTQVVMKEARIDWQPGDPIIDSNALVKTNNGQLLLVSQQNNLQDAAKLTCAKEVSAKNN